LRQAAAGATMGTAPALHSERAAVSGGRGGGCATRKRAPPGRQWCARIRCTEASAFETALRWLLKRLEAERARVVRCWATRSFRDEDARLSDRGCAQRRGSGEARKGRRGGANESCQDHAMHGSPGGVVLRFAPEGPGDLVGGGRRPGTFAIRRKIARSSFPRRINGREADVLRSCGLRYSGFVSGRE